MRRPVAMSMPVAFGRFDKELDFGRGKYSRVRSSAFVGARNGPTVRFTVARDTSARVQAELGTGGVITCSAPGRSYRDFLTRGRPEMRVC
jgi:hypothetical protein